jgi:glucosamine kinase
MGEPCYIGVDGGGSKTDFILTHTSGDEITRVTTIGTNPGIYGTAQATRTLIKGLRDLLHKGGRKQGDVKFVLLCMSGNQPYWQEVARQMSGWGRVMSRIDSEPVLYLCAPGGPALVMHGGTGSFVAARDAAGVHSFGGGLGYTLGDPGSGYDLGWRAFRRTFFQIQSWLPEGRLAQAVKEYAGRDQYEPLSQWLYSHEERNAAIANFAPRLLALAEEGDAESLNIARESLDGLAFIACIMATKLRLPSDTSLPCGLSGPVLNHPLSTKILGEQLAKREILWELKSIQERPIEGVRRLLVSLVKEG